MAKTAVTLYIDDTSLRLLVVKGEQVKNWADLPLEHGLVSDGAIVDEAKVAAKIKELFKAQRVTARRVIVGMSGLHCLSQLIALPRLPESMLAEAIWREAERVIPVPMEQLYLLRQIISTSSEEIQVFVVGLPRNAADALIKTLNLAGVKPYIADLAPLACTRVSDRATAIIFDIRPTEVDIVVMVEGVPQLVRSLTLPSEAVSLEERLPVARAELERTIKFYNSSHPETPLEPSLPIYVCGELADEPELCQSLSDELGYPLLPLPSPFKYPEGLAPSQYGVNIGLALKEVSPGTWASPSVVNLNAIPEVYRPKAPSLTKVFSRIGMVVVIGLLVPALLLIQSSAAATESLRVQLDTANQLLTNRHTQHQSLKKEITELEEKVAEIKLTRNTFTTILNNFPRQQHIVNGDLAAATSGLPGGLVLSSIAHASDGMNISGESSNETGVLTYAESLKASHRFSQVLISEIAETETGVNFTLTLWAKGQG